MKREIELLAPAGDWDALRSAVENGADAVYLGMKSLLNARRGAGNFDEDELLRACEYCHERGKKIYVTVNTVVKEDELFILEKAAESLAHAGADAAIVQDFGVASVLKQMLPSIELHASTQMAAHNSQAAAYLKEHGFSRVVLARELTFEEIRKCSDTGVETEVFCHGALCVSTSGQCLFSSMVGGRSGNRGMCAQPCRLTYSLEGDKMYAEGHLLSPKDIMTVGMLSELKKAGASSLKIEGRLKRPEYVAVVTGIYRRALDGEGITKADEEALRQIFNRGGFTKGYAPGVIDSELLSVKRPSHWGVRVGLAGKGRKIKLLQDVENQDALAVRTESGEDIPIKISGKKGEEVVNPVNKTGEVMRLVSHKQMEDAKNTVRETKRIIPLDAKIEIRVGENAKAIVSDGERTAEAEGWTVEISERNPADRERISAQFSKTGATPYEIRSIDVIADENAFVPASGLNALRRDALEKLKQLRIRDLRGAEDNTAPLKRIEKRPALEEKTRLVCQSSDTDLLLNARNAGADEIAYLPNDVTNEGLQKALVLDAFYLVLPSVLPTDALKGINRWANANASKIRGVYLTNVGQLPLEWPGEKRYDYPLNIANRHAEAFLFRDDSVFTPSVELTAKEIEKLSGRKELIAYGRVPLMHLRHCPLNAALGGGKHSECRRCSSANAKDMLQKCVLRDRMNMRFPLSRLNTGEGCVIDVLNSVPMDLSGHFEKLPKASGIRLMFTDESKNDALLIIKRYRSLLNGENHTNNETDAGAKRAPFTTGHYFRGVE
ncbi:MAG: U32 family peptidase [Clostridia bacterium]|nr:U32 family peptidase [Clostridia bacterium]